MSDLVTRITEKKDLTHYGLVDKVNVLSKEEIIDHIGRMEDLMESMLDFINQNK